MLRAFSRSTTTISTVRARSMSHAAAFAYPPARRDAEASEAYKSVKHGEVVVKDPYRWLETPPSESAETKAFVEAQAAFTASYMDKNLDRDRYREALTRNWSYEKISTPTLKDDGFYYLSYNSGLQNQYPIHRFPASELDSFSKTAGGPPGELFFDPNQLSTDGTVSLSTTAFSRTAKYWAYGLSKSGSDWFTVHVRETSGKFEGVEDKHKLADVLHFVKFSGLAWVRDSGFFYQRFPEVKTSDLGTGTAKDKDAQLYYHKLGTPQSEDVLVHEDSDNDAWMFSASTTLDGKYLIRYSSRDTAPSALVHVAEIGDVAEGEHAKYGSLKWREVVGEWGSSYSILHNEGSKFFVQTNKDAPKYKLVTFDLANDKIETQTLVAEDPDAVLESASIIKNGELMVLSYNRDVNDELYIYGIDGKQMRRLLPNYVGSLGYGSKKNQSRIFIQQTGYTSPGTIATIDLAEDVSAAEIETLRTTKMDLKPDDFIVTLERYTSKDGTVVPMIITRHKNAKLDGSAPALLYGYGGFSISLSPRFSPAWMTWVNAYEGVLAVPALRGGGEYGESWHEGGIKEKKQNVFDDFLSAAEFLIEKKYTSAGKIILNGGSNGGLLVAACTNQAREGLIGASIADVGVHDMLKFHRWTIGHFWRSDYGDPDVASDFDFIYPYSPVHNVQKGKVYPPMMITTGDHDDRVSPAHSFKLAAVLQHELASNPNPIFLRVELSAGHGAGKPTQKVISEALDKYSFASAQLGIKMK